MPLVKTRLAAAVSNASATSTAPLPTGSLLREILFSPSNITERKNCYDRFEPLQKPTQNPLMIAQMPWEKSGVCWGSVLRSQVDGKFKFFYSTDFPGVQAGAVLVDNSLQGKSNCVVCYAESDDGLVWRRPALNLHFAKEFPDNNIILTWASYYNDSPSVIEDLHDRDPQRRYKLMSKLGVRQLSGYNRKIDDATSRGEKLPNPFSLTPDQPEPLERLPFIVVVIDELADLMMVVGKKIEELIARLAQKARAAGIHLILATQRPSVDVITGLIKANIPTRIAFQVSSKIDSRTILDQQGAEALLGQGDMLYLPPGSGMPQRLHGAFVSDNEVHKVVEHLKAMGKPDYIEDILEPGEAGGGDLMAGGEAGDAEPDPLYDQALEVVLKTRRPSISLVQRHLRIGYNRAARLVEEMEKAGLVSSMSSSGQREILVPARTE